MLGSQLGIWCAFFSHFVLRDALYSHFHKLVAKANVTLTGDAALKYCLKGSLCVVVPILITLTVALAMNKTHGLQQEWLMNLQKTCEQEYDVDEQGNLVANSNGMYKGTMMEYASTSGFIGLYIGQVLFRYSGAGQLKADSFTSKDGLVHQLVYAGILICLWMAPTWLIEVAKLDDTAMWIQSIFLIALPQLVMGFVMTYNLPLASNKLLNYPETTCEEALLQCNEGAKDDLSDDFEWSKLKPLGK